MSIHPSSFRSCYRLTSTAWNHLTASGGQSLGYFFRLRPGRRLMVWSLALCGPIPGGCAFSSSSCLGVLGVGGGLGVELREPQGERALRPTDSSVGLFSGVDMVVRSTASPPALCLVSQFAERRRGTRSGDAGMRRGRRICSRIRGRTFMRTRGRATVAKGLGLCMV